MIPELGQFALILALCLAIVQTSLPLAGTIWHIPSWVALAKPATNGQWVFLMLAFGCLVVSFIQNDFSVLYVAQQSNTELPMIYRISAVWGGHEGSLLLWIVILSTWSVAVSFFSRSLPPVMAARVLAVMGFISCGFLLFILLTSNPFDRLFPAALEGRDLNPLLQDPGLIIHPPMLYMGYVGFSVAFAFAIAALLGGQLDSAWARWSRPWTVVAWLFLTFGIVLGSWWAYYELGWGGWWFWDPVENASFMPWLVGTALLHSLAVTEKRGAFKSWTVLLAIAAFSLSLLGTFLVRSGVLTSVHAFATDPARGVFILGFLVVVIGLSLTLYAWRAPKVGKGGHFELFSRESFLLVGNVLLVVAAGAVLLGTLYPLFLDALGLGKISVGPPYFGTIFYYIAAPLVVFMGIGPLMNWRSQSKTDLLKRLRIPFILALIAGFIPVIFGGSEGWVCYPDIAAAMWIASTAILNFKERLPRNRPLFKALGIMPRGLYAMTIAHVGMAVFVVGVSITNQFSIEKDVRLAINEPLVLDNLQFTLLALKKASGANYEAHRAEILIEQNGEVVTSLYPEKRVYRVQRNPMTEAAIDPGFTRDIYIALGEPLGDNAWAVRLYYKPYIRWIWLGGLMMVFAGLLSASDKRYRSKKAPEAKRAMAKRVHTA